MFAPFLAKAVCVLKSKSWNENKNGTTLNYNESFPNVYKSFAATCTVSILELFICYLHEMPWFQCCSLIIVTIVQWKHGHVILGLMISCRENTKKKCHEKVAMTAFHFIYIRTLERTPSLTLVLIEFIHMYCVINNVLNYGSPFVSVPCGWALNLTWIHV